jgi:hypothetical protein
MALDEVSSETVHSWNTNKMVMKVWRLVGSTNSHVLQCQIYQGKEETEDKDLLFGWNKWH